jgi:hypothetical protein
MIMKQNCFITFTIYMLWLLEIEKDLTGLVLREIEAGSHNNVNNLCSPELKHTLIFHEFFKLALHVICEIFPSMLKNADHFYCVRE